MWTPLHCRGWFVLAGLAQWWENSPSNNVARVRFQDLVSYVGWVCWFSTLLWEVFPWYVLQFSPLTRNQHLISCDSVWFVVRDWKVRLPLLHLVIGWENIAPVLQPMRSKTKTNHTLWAQFFPRFEQGSGNSWKFLIGSSRCLPLLWLVGLITLVLVCKPTLHQKKNPNCQETDRVEPGTIQLLVRAGLALTIYRLYYRYFCPRVMFKLMRKRRGHFIMTLTKIGSDLID